MIKYFYYLLLYTLTTTSCSNTAKLKQELFQLQSQKIALPIDQMRTFINGRDTLLPNFADCRFKLVVYSDSVECSTCMVDKIHVWDSLLLKTAKYEPQFKVFFIFSPTKRQRHDVELSLKTRHFHYPVFLDESGKFPQHNPHIPTNKALHTFLLNEDNKVILAGNPVFNPRIETLLFQKLKEKGREK